MRDEVPAEIGGLVARLDTSNHDAWDELLRLASDFAAPQEDDVTWIPPKQLNDGVRHVGFPIYSAWVNSAVELLYEVGAVTPSVDWTKHRCPDDCKPGGLTPDEAVLAATHVIRGERFCDGRIGTAVTDGLFHAVLVALGDWYRDTTRGRPEGEDLAMNDTPALMSESRPGRRAPARHIYVGNHRHGQVTHIARDRRTRLIWNADTKAFDVQELVWTTTGSWNKKQAYEQVKHGWDVADDPSSPA